jgi:hypothetical protein
MRTQRLEVAEGLIEELVSAHKDAETRAKKFEQQVFFFNIYLEELVSAHSDAETRVQLLKQVLEQYIENTFYLESTF